MGISVESQAMNDKRKEVESMWQSAKQRKVESQKEDDNHVRFQSDKWRYQKEARQYYSDPVKAFATELLQNSLDAMNAVGKNHQMTLGCTVRDVELHSDCLGMQRRVEVTFQDNGTGMDRTVLQHGLLCIGASGSTRTDAGRKSQLSESAGGFGLAKVLLYLGQTSFKIWTRMKGGVEYWVSADPFRKDQEVCAITKAAEVGHQSFSKNEAHGTKAVITLDPCVMEIQKERLCNIDQDFYKTHALSQHFSKAEDFSKKFRQVWVRSNLPVSLTLDGSIVNMNADLGEFQTYIFMNLDRRFAALYSNEINSQVRRQGSPPLRVHLQTLSGRLNVDRTNASKSTAGYFLYLCDLISIKYNTIVLDKSLELSVLLFTEDQHGTSFQCTDLLKGTRDDLTQEAKGPVMDMVQKFIIDRYSVKPPKPKVSWYTSEGSRSFSQWLQDLTGSDPQSQIPPNKWQTATKIEADRYFKGKPWRAAIRYNYAIFVEASISSLQVPSEFRSTDTVSGTSMMWMELFGVFVREILDVFKDEVKARGKSTLFNIGIYVGERDFVRPILSGSDGSKQGMPTFLINKAYVQNMLKDDDWSSFSMEAVVKSMTCLKTMALREVIFLLHGFQEGAATFASFQQYQLRLEEASLYREWSWFSRYKETVECHLMRGVQDGLSDVTRLRSHVVAMQAPVSNDRISREVLQYEKARLEEQVAQIRARADEDDPFNERDVMPNPAARLTKLKPSEIRYSQDSCSQTFRCGRSLELTAKQLKDGNISAEINIPVIHVFKWLGSWFTADNRRLWAFRTAGLNQVPVKIISFNEVWSNKLTTRNQGVSITLRGR
ncbi:unnamed protein product [Polarella glacialis]|uniref:Uncharacterized protein n=1 Tax=Polarella glacialis TaxID=89957 RepID=A0A813HQL8_POLGL|nr:unnamed protein product [Polarella glacialis]